jgi:hypothetical protein
MSLSNTQQQKRGKHKTQYKSRKNSQIQTHYHPLAFFTTNGALQTWYSFNYTLREACPYKS